MKRYTFQSDGRNWIASDALEKAQAGYAGAAADRLTSLENWIDALTAEQSQLAASLAELRAEGRAKTTRFNQLLARKLTVGQMLSAMRAFGVLSPADDAQVLQQDLQPDQD